MLRTLLCSCLALLISGVAFVFAEDWTGRIKKVEGDKVTFQKGKFNKETKKFEDEGDPVTLSAKDAKVSVGKFNKETKKVDYEDVKEGIGADVFKNIDAEKGKFATVTVEDKKITAIKIGGRGGK